MLKIGEFSKVSKTTIKALRYYDKEGIFKPIKIDENGYRYYEIDQLNTLLKIVEYRNLGLSIKDIKKILDSGKEKEILSAHLDYLKLQNRVIESNIVSLQKIILEGVNMRKYEIIAKNIPDFNVYYRHGKISSMDKITEFVLEAGAEAGKNNPNIKCLDYCFITYTAKEYKEKDVELEYCEAVDGEVKESKNIKSKIAKGGKFITLEHLGSYNGLKDAYAFALNYVKNNNLEISGDIREVYIHGCWDCEKEDDYLTEIQIPIV